MTERLRKRRGVERERELGRKKTEGEICGQNSKRERKGFFGGRTGSRACETEKEMERER